MKKLKNDSREFKLTPKFVKKSDEDIATIAALNDYVNKTENVLVITGGYATEALCGGKITRAHGDVDASIVLNSSVSLDNVKRDIRKLLLKESTKWIVKKKNPNRIDYIESGDKKMFFDKRKIEIHLVPSGESKLKYVKKKLINSRGKEIEVRVINLMQTATEKIHKFYEVRLGIDTTKDRHSSMSDYYDLKMLLELKELNKKDIRNFAPEEYDYVVSLLTEF